MKKKTKCQRKSSSSEPEVDDAGKREQPEVASFPAYRVPIRTVKFWTKQEEHNLPKYRETQKMTFNSVAMEMNRTVASVKSKYYRLKEKQRLQSQQDEDESPELLSTEKIAAAARSNNNVDAGSDNDGRDDSKNIETSYRTGKSWSKEEEQTLAHYRQQGLPWKEIALKMDRSVGSCTSKWQSIIKKEAMPEQQQQRKQQERSSSAPRPPPPSSAPSVTSADTTKTTKKYTDDTITDAANTPASNAPSLRRPYQSWTAEETDALVRYRNKKLPWEEIALRLGRSVASCQAKNRRL
ncbi:hypothetical protein BDB00DRAFT_793855 [Zychaea mexicana]|uniref:uncharacterized protein n=1 Tax=Zychaea mexicana TaxID=64656 RepID=UPI0022FF13CC|nr:uncharacterized protein BDB00DRAFT_793855 [Zychaea mexicana]KAI9466520.1 hypothetical protein BDB00DRAFT_793855 [Zychaea mexicana]